MVECQTRALDVVRVAFPPRAQRPIVSYPRGNGLASKPLPWSRVVRSSGAGMSDPLTREPAPFTARPFCEPSAVDAWSTHRRDSTRAHERGYWVVVGLVDYRRLGGHTSRDGLGASRVSSPDRKASTAMASRSVASVQSYSSGSPSVGP